MKILKDKAEIIDFCAVKNTPEFNTIKVLEEIAEFQEVVTKIVTKHPNNPDKPQKEELIKEFGDLIYRGIVYLKQQFPNMSIKDIDDALQARIEKKLSKLEEYRKDELYKNGL